MNENIQRHYTRPDLGKRILAALNKAGKDINRLTPEDLAPVDEFHIRGRAATLELAQAARLNTFLTWAAVWVVPRAVSRGNSGAV